MNHSEWKTRRHRKLLGETVEGNTEYDRLYEEAELAHDLGQMVYDRRTALGLSQTELAERCGMKQPQISRIEGGGTVPTIPLLRRLARALDADLTIELTPQRHAA
ncbi:MAG TPA: helix-turn-helix transcriptional regulator [Streptomyces sp.]|jgi:Predicted transcriptional regulator with C-terminal CBS domains